MSLGQFLQHVGGELMSTGAVQIWPGMPVEEALIEDERGDRHPPDRSGRGQGRQSRSRLHARHGRTRRADRGGRWAGGRGRAPTRYGTSDCPTAITSANGRSGMKMVVDLPEGLTLEPGTVFHTFGYPEPEIFGFFYVHPDRVATVGIFVPFVVPQSDAHLVSLPAALHAASLSVAVSEGRQAAQLGREIAAGIGHARRTVPGGRRLRAHRRRLRQHQRAHRQRRGRGVDYRRRNLREAVLELLQAGKPLTKENLEATYVARRRASWVEEEGRVAEKARDGFHRGMIPGLLGMAMAGFTDGKHSIERRAEADARPRGVLPRNDSRRRTGSGFWTTAARAASAATTR